MIDDTLPLRHAVLQSFVLTGLTTQFLYADPETVAIFHSTSHMTTVAAAAIRRRIGSCIFT